MQSPTSGQQTSHGEPMEVVVGEGVDATSARMSRANSATENGIPIRNTKSPSHSRPASLADDAATSDPTGTHRDRRAHVPTNIFDISPSGENDRSALTRYTHQTLTSLAAYRDALIDENGRLNAMLQKTKLGLEVLATKSGVEREQDGETFGKERESANARTMSIVDIVKAGMMEELKQLRGRMVQLREEERNQPESAEERIDAALQQRHSSTAPDVTEDSTMIVYYTIVNKLRKDLDASKKARDEAKVQLGSICQQKSAQPAIRSRLVEGSGSRDRRTWQPKTAVARDRASVKEIVADALRRAGVDVAEDVALLPLLTDQEEAVWLRERKEREMEKALRDMRCYVEAMIREWREVRFPADQPRTQFLTADVLRQVGSLPPPGKYQTLSYPDLNLPYIPTQIFPKRKGRPPRTTVKVQQIPESLQHLLARGRINRGVEQARERERDRFKLRSEPVSYHVADALAAQRVAKRKGQDGDSVVNESEDDAVRKRRRTTLGENAPEYDDQTAGSLTRTPRDDSIDGPHGPHADMLRAGNDSPHPQQEPLSADQLYGVSASAISDAMQAYTQQPMQDESSVFGPAEEPYDSADGSFDTQIPYQGQMAQRRTLGYNPGTLVNGGNVFDNPEDIQLGPGGDRSEELHHETGSEYGQSNPFRAYHQAAQDSVEGLIQRHLRNTQTPVEGADTTLLQHVNGASLEVSDAQQALDQYRFEDALMNHDITSPEAAHATTTLQTSLNTDSEDATALAAQRLMNSLAPQAEADFETACENCGRRDTGAWRKLTIDGVDHKVCNGKSLRAINAEFNMEADLTLPQRAGYITRKTA